jgi:sulfite exporter TauE/SafE
MSHLLAGLALGVAGSAHCAMMCGPLVLVAQSRSSARGQTPGGWRLWAHVLSYHAGRALTYVVLGMLAGTAGDGLARGGLGPFVSALAGVLLIAHGTGLSAKVPRSAWTHAPGAASRWIARAVRLRHMRAPVLHGAVHGLLPCGTLYLAIVAAAGLGDTREAATFMAGFAAGTMPVLAVIAVSGPAIAGRLPRFATRAAPAVVALVGLLLIARGLDVAPVVHGVVPVAAAANGAHASHQP